MVKSQAITRQSKSNLALAFILLPRAKRDEMSALYAFCREVDNVADDEGRSAESRRSELAEWREDLKRIFSGQTPVKEVLRELRPVIEKYRLPFENLDEVIRGVEMDLDKKLFRTLDELEQYCYRVASAVGLLSIEIFGYSNPACREYAISLGKALQLTNILRDVKTDALDQRIYFPTEMMERFSVRPEEILRLEYSDRFYRLANELADRARGFYRAARNILPAEDRRSMLAAELMGSLYWRLLRQLETRRFNVFAAKPARLGMIQKTALILKTWYRLASGAVVPNYGTP